MNKCNNCGYCQNHCNCDGERECEREEIEIEEPEFIPECGEIGDDELPEWEPELIEEETKDNPDIIK